MPAQSRICFVPACFILLVNLSEESLVQENQSDVFSNAQDSSNTLSRGPAMLLRLYDKGPDRRFCFGRRNKRRTAFWPQASRSHFLPR
jgi:hypothetical protein